MSSSDNSKSMEAMASSTLSIEFNPTIGLHPLLKIQLFEIMAIEVLCFFATSSTRLTIHLALWLGYPGQEF